MLLPARAFDAATASLAAAAPALPAAFWAGAACVPESAFDPSALPPLTLTLAGAGPGDALDLVVPWRRLVVLVPASQYCLESPPRGGEDRWAYALGAVDEGRNAILGQALFEEYYVAHAYDGPWIGFAPIRGCGPTAVFEALEDRAAPVALAVVAFVLFFAAALAIQGYLPALPARIRAGNDGLPLLLCCPSAPPAATMSGARAPDANVNAFLKREHELNMAKAYCDQTDFVSRNAEFAEKGTLKVIAATRARQVEAAAAEMRSAARRVRRRRTSAPHARRPPQASTRSSSRAGARGSRSSTRSRTRSTRPSSPPRASPSRSEEAGAVALRARVVDVV